MWQHSIQGRIHGGTKKADAGRQYCNQGRSLRSFRRQRSLESLDEGTLTKTKEMLGDMHKCKIDMTDEIYVINVGGYIGSSTRSEIDYAVAAGKLVHYLEAIKE